MAKIETEDHRAALSQSPLSPWTKATEVSQQSNSEGTCPGDAIHPAYKHMSNDGPR